MIRKDGVVLGGKNVDTTSESFKAIVGHSLSPCARYLIDNAIGQERAEKFDTLTRMVMSDAVKFRFTIEEYLRRFCGIEDLQDVYETYHDYDTIDCSFQSIDQYMSSESLDEIQWLEMGVTIANNGHNEDDLAEIYIRGDDYLNLYYGYDSATRYLIRILTSVIIDMVSTTDVDDLDSTHSTSEIVDTLDLLSDLDIITDIFNN